jgi:hypothetical protein
MECKHCQAESGDGNGNWVDCDFPDSEQDPNGISAHDPGAKLDAGKPMAGVLGDFGLALLEVAKVGTFGAEKYSRGGWQSVENGQERYRDAAIRHLLIQHVEDIDNQSDLLHLAHQAWNVLAELELKLRESRSER